MEQNSIPRMDLTTFFFSISSAAFMGLGLMPGGPENAKGEPEIDLQLAQQNIDLLELMHEKTKGNRTPDEDKLIEQLLFETRLRFVEVQKAQEVKKRK